MMIGSVNADREAMLQIRVLGPHGQSVVADAVVDTGFTDDLSLPADLLAQLQLPFAKVSKYTLADGTEEVFDVYRGKVIWQGEERRVDVLDAPGSPLVGMGLLEGSRLTIDVVAHGPMTVVKLA
jgi:clan AA aspartic protease